jgi:acetoin utilization deacetylase AcuC-like enzyme
VSRKSIGLITHPSLGGHSQPFPRPHIESFENPFRVQMAQDHLMKEGILEDVQRIPAEKGRLEDAELVHSHYLIESVKLMSELGSGYLGESAYASPDLLRSTLQAIGATITASNAVIDRHCKHAFALTRPPGHHVSTSMAMGLCYFNNVAIAVKHAIKIHEIKRVTILDFDNHFGNGTCEIFYTNPDVQYISMHEYDYENFGLGHYEEIGYGEAEGTNVNIPLVDMTPDVSYRTVMSDVIEPAIKSFEPELIAVSAGYDPHYADPVGNMNADSSTFWRFGKIVRSLCDSIKCGSFWVLEGGYNPMTLGLCIEASLRGLAGEPLPEFKDQIPRAADDIIVESNEEIVYKVLEIISKYW